MASNLPPGVTGNEPELTGYPECPNCDEPYDPSKSGGVCEWCDAFLFDPYESYYDANEDYIRENR